MRRPPNYVPAEGLRVRRRIGTYAGRIFTIRRVIALGAGVFNIEGTDIENGVFAENYELVVEEEADSDDAPAAQFHVGQEVIINDRVVGVEDRNCEVAAGYVGQHGTVNEISPDGLIRFSWSNGSNQWQLMPEYLDAIEPLRVAPSPDPDILAIGEEVEIVGLAAALIRVGAPSTHVGLVGIVVGEQQPHVNADGGFWQKVVLEGDRDGYYYPVANLRRTKELVADKPTFDAAWRLIRNGPQLPSLMPDLWGWIAKPVQTLSRTRGEWGQMILCRAVLRLRRQTPNSYEEQLVKGQALTATKPWIRAWEAAATQPIR